jgi:hemerythrin superfamily protein
MVVSHEVAEEMVVYPAIRSDAPGGDHEADERIEEQAKAERKLAAMERLDPASEEFGSQLVSLESAVLRHAEAEESEVFPLLQAVEDSRARQAMALRYLRAKDGAPTHPHPHSSDKPPGNRLLGPVTALFDKARDAARRN